jgi:hypothetical protein
MVALLLTSGMTNLSYYEHWAVPRVKRSHFRHTFTRCPFPLKVTVVAKVAAAVVDDTAETVKEATGKL